MVISAGGVVNQDQGLATIYGSEPAKEVGAAFLLDYVHEFIVSSSSFQAACLSAQAFCSDTLEPMFSESCFLCSGMCIYE